MADGGRGRRDDRRRSPASRARTGCSSRPIPARPSSRSSAGRSRRTPAARTRSSTASPATGSRAWRRCSRRASSCRVGGALRKDVAGYDLRALLTGSEGTLGIITAAWLRFVPAPERRLALVAAYPDAAAGCAAVLRVLASGIVPAALEFFDEGTIRARRRGLPGRRPATGSSSSRRPTARTRRPRACATSCARRSHRAATRCTRPSRRARSGAGATASRSPSRPPAAAKLSEDIAVPVDRLEEAIAETVRIGARHDLEACSWGHAGDGNVHATLPARSRRRGAARPRRRGRAGAVRPRAAPRRHGHRRARHRRAEGRPALAPVGAGRRRRAPARSSGARSEGALQPGQEAALIS